MADCDTLLDAAIALQATPARPAMVTDAMIEAVARAIWREDYVLDPKGDLAEMGEITAPRDEAELADWPVDKERCERQGRAAIAAMLAASPIEDDLVKRLRQHRIILKSGDYDGAQLMEAWCDMINAADRIEAQSQSIRVMREALNEAFDFLGGVDGASEIRDSILNALSQTGEK